MILKHFLMVGTSLDHEKLEERDEELEEQFGAFLCVFLVVLGRSEEERKKMR